jgi:ATP-binding cassette, subfamily B, multidrug efflux pump
MSNRPPAPNLPIGPRPGGGPGFRPPAEKLKDTRGTLMRIWGFLKLEKGNLILSTLLVIAGIVFGLLGPYLMGMVIDQYILKNNLSGLAQTSLVMLAVYIGLSVVTWLQTFIMAVVAQRTVHQMRKALFAHLQLLPLRFFDQTAHGELMSRLTNDVENVSQVLGDTVSQIISSVLTIIGTAIMMFVINWQLALVSLTTIPLMVVITRYISSRTLRGFREQQEYLGKLNGLIEETITGERVVIAYGRRDDIIADFEQVNRRLQSASTYAQSFSGVIGPVNNFAGNTGFATVALAGGYMAILGWVTVGTISIFINYAQQFARPLNMISNLINTIQSAMAGAERFFAILDEACETADEPDAISLPQVRGEIVFEQVTFGYAPERPVLKNVSLHALPGQTIAIVGPTGAGKTTIINLLSRFYDIQSGAIRIDGHDIRNVSRSDLRRQLGVVLQDTFLFSNTVMENIRYGRLDATDEEVHNAARLANADHFIRALPHGYQTQLSEGAGNLSQGQRQLLAIARAVLADPGILVLDEATSSVDTRTERQIQEALHRLMEGRTSFVIAHRLSTIRDADCILVIQQGEIVERGTHSSLMELRGAYYNLYRSQFKNQTGMMPAEYN